jgi:hypothetical protein
MLDRPQAFRDNDAQQFCVSQQGQLPKAPDKQDLASQRCRPLHLN